MTISLREVQQAAECAKKGCAPAHSPRPPAAGVTEVTRDTNTSGSEIGRASCREKVAGPVLPRVEPGRHHVTSQPPSPYARMRRGTTSYGPAQRRTNCGYDHRP